MNARRAGFTLLELLVVLVLLAITASAAVPAFLGDAARTADQRTATALADALIATRQSARESGAPSTFTLSPSDGRYWITAGDSSSTGRLPIDGGASISANAERITVRFEPTGAATPVSVTIRGARSLAVHVEPFTGDVFVDDGHVR